ncbi:MAG: methionine--tRNA ligase subunit beta [Candidatus Pacebacteria bacterium]|nr:methionine--tRNA ligase subunit beta [Candidatus Paceibacterota bacterium]MDD5721665.1 methionine--tRNA ligase subunit beta [Candidatus Paceibacterota bacterium]
MEKEKFEQLVSQALKKIPYNFLNKMENIAIVVQDEPTEFQKEKLGYIDGNCLLGLYEGVPQIKRGYYYQAVPDKITFFKNNIERIANEQEERIKEIIEETVWHEIGHHFGLDEDEIRERIKRKKPFSDKKMINFKEFEQLDLRIAKILKAEKLEGTDKLLVLEIDLGEEKRQIIAGIGHQYKPELLINKKIVVVANLEPREIKGKLSQGMLLAVDASQGPVLLIPEGEVLPGSKVK